MSAEASVDRAQLAALVARLDRLDRQRRRLTEELGAAVALALSRADDPSAMGEVLAGLLPPRETPRSRRQPRSAGHRGVDVDAAAVRSARLEAGLTLGQLAIAAGVTRQAIHQVETGRCRPRLQVLERIAAKTGRDVGQFLTETLRHAS